jgi:hypothetical protein
MYKQARVPAGELFLDFSFQVAIGRPIVAA